MPDEVVETLYALDEPWRSRFLVLVAKMANGWQWDGRVPGRKNVEGWLQRPGVRRATILLLRAWGELKDEKQSSENA
ncbi:MAG: hypothetical protein DRI79_12910, partial [Chloroflexi bacterium]